MYKKVSYGGMMLSAAMIFSYIEHLVPLDFIAPGVKLGLANCVFLITLMVSGAPLAVAVNLLRVGLTVLFFGNPITLIFSLSGACLSMLSAVLLYKTKLLTPSGIGSVSGIVHNLAQLASAAFLTGSYGVFWYLPVLLISGAICGFATGAAATLIKKRVKNFF